MTKSLIVFVHGLGGDARGTWARFPDLLRADPDVSARYTHVKSYQYATGKIGATESLAHIALHLAGEIDTWVRELGLDEIAFITHSQGGLLARRYLCSAIARVRPAGQPLPLFRLLTFATPHWGAFSKIAGGLVPDSHAQVKDLAFDAAAIHELNQQWSATDAESRIRVLRVVADADAVVPNFSAMGASYDLDYRIVHGFGHLDVVKVNDPAHPCFTLAKNFLLELASAQPALVNPDTTPPMFTAGWYRAEPTGNHRFIYTTRYIPFYGRLNERALVMKFLIEPAPEHVAWMWVKGDGGVGKSRLALELALACQADWHAGFLNREAEQPDWTRWQPQLPSLLIVDYATYDIGALGRLLRGLCNRGPDYRLRRPVRILLLDRNHQEERLAEAIGVGSEAIGIQASRRADLDIRQMEDPWPLIEQFLARAGASVPEKGEAMARLARIDPAQRPLFAMLFADMLAQGEKIDTITRESLIENVVNRERAKYWQPAANAHGVKLPKMERTLAFATIVNGLPLDKVTAPLEAWDADQAPAVFNVMSGYDTHAESVNALAPDLIGECFALENIAGMPELRARAMLELAWNEWPAETFAFFDRVIQDFPAHSVIEIALKATELDSRGGLAWAQWITNLLGRTGVDFPERARDAMGALMAMASARPDDTRFKIEQAKAMFNSITDLGKLDPPAARVLLAQLESLAEANPHVAEVRSHFGQSTFNLFIDTLQLAPEAVAPILGQLALLKTRFPAERDFLMRLAMATCSAISETALADREGAQRHLDDLRQLAEDHADEPELRNLLAHGCGDLAIEFSQTDSAACSHLLAELRELAAADSPGSDIQGHLVRALAYVATEKCEADPIAAKQLHAELWALQKNHQDHPKRIELIASVTFNVISVLADFDPGTAQVLFADLSKLAVANPGSQAIRAAYAKAAVNLIGSQGLSEPVAATSLLSELVALAEAHTDEPNMRVCQVRGMARLIKLLAPVDSGAALQCLADLRGVTESHPDEPDLRTVLAAIMFRLVVLADPHDLAVCNILVKDLGALARAYPDEPGLRQQQAKAIVVTIGHIGSTDPQASLALLSHLRAITQKYPQHAEIRLAQTHAMVRLIANFLPLDVGMAKTLRVELGALVDRFPDDAEIRIDYAKALSIHTVYLASTSPVTYRPDYETLRGLAVAHADNARVRHCWVCAMAELILLLRPDAPATAESLLAELKIVARAYPHEAEIQDSLSSVTLL